MASSDFRTDINGLRAVSVGLVVFFHARIHGAGGGFIGVDVFLVISGFLMTKIILGGLDAGTFSFWKFIGGRAARIWPALGALVLGLLLVGSLALPPSDLLQIAKQAVWALAFWSNQYFLDHAGYATDGADGHWFLHTWSLSLEWQFYLVYPLLLMWAARIRTGVKHANEQRHSIVMGIGLLALLMLSLCCYLVESASRPNSAFFSLWSRAWEPLAGGLVFWLGGWQTKTGSRSRARLSYAGVAIIVLSALWFGLRHLDPVGLGGYSIVPVAGAMVILWSAWPRNVLLDNAFMQAIGRWSYSIYLWHWPLVVICAMDAVLDRHPLAGVSFVVVGSVVLGSASFRLVEMTRRNRSPAGIRLWSAKPLLALGLAAIAAGAVVATNGLEFRMPHTGNTAPVKSAAEADYFPADCSNFQKEGRDVRPCEIDKPGRRTVLVIGDSLAEHLYPWFKNHSRVPVHFLTEADCPPVPNFDRLQPAFHCMDYARLAWHEATLPQYDTVVVSGNWGMVGGVGPVYCHADSGRCKVVDGDERRDLVLAELRSALQEVLAAGKTVVLLQGTPTAYLNVPQRIERERYWFGAPRMKISMASVLANYAWIDPLFDSFIGTPGYHLVSLRPTLCNAVTCDVYDTTLERPIYVDERHFDPVWMSAHGDIFEPFVQADRKP